MFTVGETIAFDYNGKPRCGKVEKVCQTGAVTLKLEDGSFRSFKPDSMLQVVRIVNTPSLERVEREWEV